MIIKTQLMDKKALDRALTRIAHEIVEKNKGIDGLYLLGVKTRGVLLAERLSRRIALIEDGLIPYNEIDITSYRDDIHRESKEYSRVENRLHFKIEGKKAVLVDDVLYTGRTVRAAMDAIIDIGRPIAIQLAVLIDRGHRELPIRADYVGKNVPTSRNERIIVNLSEIDEEDSVLLVEKE